jgi:PAS domain S-box-containing protein
MRPNKGRLAVHCAAICRWILLVLCLAVGGPAGLAMAEPVAPRAAGGVIDLRGWDFARDAAVPLDGEWRIQWGLFDDPSRVAAAEGQPIQVPGPWNALMRAGQPVGAEGHATYSLTVLCDSPDGLALLMPAQHSAMYLYVNGRLLATQGQPGASPESATPRMSTRMAWLTPDMPCPLRIVAHVSNFNDLEGGLVGSISIGNERVMTRQRGQAMALDVALMSGFAVMGLLPLAFFALRPKELTPLWFGLFCLATAVYFGLTREHVLERLFLDVDWEAYLKAEHLAWYLGTPCFLLFVQRLFPAELSRRAVGALVVPVLAAALLVLLAPAKVYSPTVPYVTGLTVAAALYAVWGMALARRRRRPGASIILGGMVVLVGVLLADVLHCYEPLEWQLLPFGILAFVVAEAFVMAQRVVRALRAEELRAIEQRHRANLLVRATQAGILDLDLTSDTLRYSERYKEMLGYPPDADTADWPHFFDTVHPDWRDPVRQAFLEQMDQRDVRSGAREHESWEFPLRRADGGYVWVRAQGLTLTDAEGRALRYVGSFIDITEQREMAESLRASRDQVASQAALLERQNEQLKQNVLLREEVERIGRHDLKTPLNSILAVPRLLRERHRLPAEDEELLGIVERAGHRILNLINLSLDLFRMEQGSYRFRPQPVDLAEVLRTVIDDLRSHAASKGVSFRLLLDGEEPDAEAGVHVLAEELLCYSMLANLLKNALEASPEQGVVTLALRRGEMLELRIHNGGQVPEGVRQRFFEKYASSGKAQGTGLGAYSARLMARIQGGELSMQTSATDGTTLILRMRAAPAEMAAAAEAEVRNRSTVARLLPLAGLPALRVLLVDDDEYSQLVMRRYLPSPPLRVRAVVNGRAALDAAAAEAPDLILMDLEMPVLDGLSATRQLREQERATGRRPSVIVLLSSHDDAQTANRALEAGCDLFLTKPIAKEALLRTVLWASNAAGGGQPSDAFDLEDQGAPVTIDPELRDRLPGFLSTRRELLATMAASDAEQVRRLAHRMAGSFGLYGFEWAAERCREIEMQAGQLAADALQQRIDALRRHLDAAEARIVGAAAAT